MPSPRTRISVCLPCQLRLLARSHTIQSSPRPTEIQRSLGLPTRPSGLQKQKRSLHSGGRRGQELREAANLGQQTQVAGQEHVWTPHHFAPAPGKPAETELGVVVEGRSLHDALLDIEGEKPWLKPTTVEDIAKNARQHYGDHLPEGVLSETEYKIYERLYGAPLPEHTVEEPRSTEEEESKGTLLREGQDGVLEEVEYSGDVESHMDEEELLLHTEQEEEHMSAKRSKADTRLQKDIEAVVGTQEVGVAIKSPDEPDPFEEEDEDDVGIDLMDNDDDSQTIRTHPFTLAARFATNPKSLSLPQNSFVGPVSLLLADLANKHLDESASRIFGGPALPYATGTPASSKQMPQKPIPLSASQARMTEMEADLYMATVMPGTYASVMSVLIELRKRLGSQWIEGLLGKDGGPRILDAGAGGAGVLAWREVLKAEWRRLHPQQEGMPEADAEVKDSNPPPLGKATVLTGSGPLRQRASILLDNTTFIPRLPDYVHTHFDEDAQRKQFDIIVAPHSLWHLQEDFERRQRVLNLWSLLDPRGGVLVILEKGVPRGFEVIADARSYLLGELLQGSPLIEEEELRTTAQDQEHSSLATGFLASEPTKSHALKASRRAPGRIIAPCTNHSKCPMYLVPGTSRQRKDYCHFSQRHIRPPYLQRMLGARDRNFEDVKFSYVAVQKGIAWDDDSKASEPGSVVLRGVPATERAFVGYEVGDEDIVVNHVSSSSAASSTAPPSPAHFAHPLPRLILPPLKRHGHVLLDVCTPAGTLERWTVTRAYGRQGYRDARKARWGDLWAVGAGLRSARRVRLGWGHLERGIGTGRGMEGIRDAAASGAAGGERKRNVGAKGANGNKNGPIRDVVGRVKPSSTSGTSADLGEGVETGDTSKEKRVRRRKEEKEKGRLKARRRRREETREIYGRGRDGGDV